LRPEEKSERRRERKLKGRKIEKRKMKWRCFLPLPQPLETVRTSNCLPQMGPGNLAHEGGMKVLEA
jgi:hypothetical protein